MCLTQTLHTQILLSFFLSVLLHNPEVKSTAITLFILEHSDFMFQHIHYLTEQPVISHMGHKSADSFFNVPCYLTKSFSNQPNFL